MTVKNLCGIQKYELFREPVANDDLLLPYVGMESERLVRRPTAVSQDVSFQMP